MNGGMNHGRQPWSAADLAMFHSHGRPSSVSSEDSTHSYNTVMREDLVSAVLGERGAVHASPAHGHGHSHAHAPPVVVDGSLAHADGDRRDARLLDDFSSHRTNARRISISLTPR
jgi:hypothetical protein